MRVLAGNYRAIAEVSCNRLARAWLAQQVGADESPVLIRVLTPANRQQRLALAHLRREAAALALLAHPGIARIYECEQGQDGKLYIVTECVDGPSVASWLVAHGPFPLGDVLEIAGQCARVMHVGQQLGIRNRDLRLDSVFVARDASGGWQVKIRDFGLPSAPDSFALMDGWGAADDLGEPSGSDSSAPDVSSLGRAVYAMLTGDPWTARTDGPLRPVSAIRIDVPPSLDTVLCAVLDPAVRMSYQSATEFWSVLRDTVIEDAEPEDGTAAVPFEAIVDRAAGTEAGSARPRLGELMLAEGLISPTQLRTALRQQAQESTEARLGHILLQRGWVTREQLLSVLQKYKRKYRLGDLMVETNTITEEQLAIALQEQVKSGRRLGELIVQFEYVSERVVREALSKQLGISFIELDRISIDSAMARVIPPEVARHHRAIPIARQGDRLTVVLEDPTNSDAVEELRRRTGCNIEVVTTEEASFRRAFAALYHRAADTKGNHDSSQQAALNAGAEREGLVHQEEIEANLTRLQSQYAALLQEHEAAVRALRKQEEQCESLLRERQEVAEGLARLARHVRE